MAHSRKIAFSGVSLTKARVNKLIPKLMPELQDEMEQLIVSSGYLNGAPFTWIGLMFRFGLLNEGVPHYQGIDNKDGELVLAIEIDTHELLEPNREHIKQVLMAATLKALIHAGKKYKLPLDALEDRLNQLTAKPD
ncbi:MAG: Imm39 family immunity protein [Pseudomonadota bacterium]|nr:Imm39 family immunity protein [Pseudomonadota bacterium]